MHLRHLLVGLDDSDEGRTALLAAADLAGRSRARLTVLRVAQTSAGLAVRERCIAELRDAVAARLGGLPDSDELTCDVTFGLPGVEIPRYAETNAVDLVLLGRKRRTELQRRLIGDTADAVARRSSLPCLFVPTGRVANARIVVALDGTERGIAVLVTAIDFAREVHGRLLAMTVEPETDAAPDGRWHRSARSERLAQAVATLRQTSGLGEDYWEEVEEEVEGGLVVHQGAVVNEVLAELDRAHADLLAIGFHRGGPAGVLEAGSIARRLAHEAPCSVLTVPL